MAAPQQHLELVGGGGHALVVLDAARSAGLNPTVFWDDDPRAVMRDRLEYGGTIAQLAKSKSAAHLIIAIGSIASRRRVLDALGPRTYATVIHPRAIISPTATIGPGSFIGPGAIVNPLAAIGTHAIINTGAIVEHECVVDENVHLGPGSVLGGAVTIGRDTLVGLGASVLPLMKIGARCVIGAGAVVACPIADGSTAVGVPARVRSSAGKS